MPPLEADSCSEPGVVCTWLGQAGVAAYADDGYRLDTALYFPQDVAFGSDGAAWVVDLNNNRIRRIGPDGMVQTVTGGGMPGDGHETQNCWVGCDARGVGWWHPGDIVVDPDDPNRVYAAAWHNSRVSMIDHREMVLHFVAGDGTRGHGDGRLDLPSSVVIGSEGELYVSDQGNELVRRIDPDGTLTDIAGIRGRPGYSGDGGPALEAQLHGALGWESGPGSKLALDGSSLFIADTLNGVIRRIDLDTGTIEAVAGQYRAVGMIPVPLGPAVTLIDRGSEPGYAGDGGPALEAVFSHPRDIALGHHGELYIADTGNHCVRMVDSDGIVSTVVGRCGESGYEGDGGPATEALLWQPTGVTVDLEGALYVTDSYNQIVRRVQP